MRGWVHSRITHWLVAAVCLAVLAACGESSTPATTRGTNPDTTTTAVPGELGLVVSPQFVQGVIPGEQLVLLATLTVASDGPVNLTAQAAGVGADVSVRPSTISEGEVAEVTVIPQPTAVEGELTVTIMARTTDREQAVTKTTPVVPWADDRGEQGATILGLFTPWLAEHEPDLGISPDTEFTGTFVAPNLLIVSHYVFFSDAWEVGVSWHIMVPPDDFAEAYLRPRDALRPTRALRIGSWQTALDTGVVDVTEVEPPAEVVR